MLQSTVIRWIAPVAVLVFGIVISFTVSGFVRQEAVRSWSENAEQSSQWLNGALLGWLEESYAMVSGIAILAEGSEDIDEDEFFDAYDGLEARASAFFLEVVAIAEPVDTGGQVTDWEIVHSSDPYDAFDIGVRVSETPALADTLGAGAARIGRVVLGQPFVSEGGSLSSAIVIVTDSPSGLVAIIATLPYESLIDGLKQVYQPVGASISLSGRFPNAMDRGVLVPIHQDDTSNSLFSTSERTISAEAELLLSWEFDDQFAGGPSIGFAQAVLIGGLAISLLITLVIAGLVVRNQEIAVRVEKATASLSQQQSLLQAVLESITQGLIAYDKDLRLIVANSQMKEVRGVEDQFMAPGASFEDWVRSDAANGEFGEGDADEQANHRIELARGFTEHNFTRPRPNGRIVQVQGGPLPGGGFVSTFTDVTERKAAEKKIIENEQQIRSLLETSNEGIWMIDNDGETTQINDSLSKILGRASEEVVGRYLYEFLDEPSKLVFYEQLERRKKGISTSYEVVIDRKDGTKVPVVINGTPMYEASGTKIGSFGMVTDITEVKKKEAELRAAYDVISSSIDYASHLQQSVLPPAALESEMFASFFAFWEPRDVVGGDMYWIKDWGGRTLLIVGDCTGHGVPGAFMTLLATSALNEAMRTSAPGDVAGLVNTMHRHVQAALGQDAEDPATDDGMDMAACLIGEGGRSISYCGAHFPLFRWNGQEVEEFRGSRRGIGYPDTPGDQVYEQKEISVSESDTLYLTSDGVLDQIGGDRRLGFGKRRFIRMLKTVALAPFADQREAIISEVRAYQGGEPTRDDKCVIAFRTL